MQRHLARLALLGALTIAGPLAAQESAPAEKKHGTAGHFAERQQEIETLAARIVAAADEDKDGRLSQAEAKAARGHVAIAMRENLPKAGFITGGEVMLDRMEREILSTSIDTDRDRFVSPLELQKYIAHAIVVRERILRSPVEVQFWISEEELKFHDFNRENRQAMAQQKLAQTEWQRMAKRQRDRVWYESEMVRRIMAAEQQRDWLKQREREKNQPDSPGQESATAKEKTAEPAPAEPQP